MIGNGKRPKGERRNASAFVGEMEREWRGCGGPTMTVPGPAAAAAAAKAGLGLDHREMRLSHPAVMLVIEPGSGVALPGGGELDSVLAAEWFTDGASSRVDPGPGATRVLFMAAAFRGAVPGSRKIVVLNVLLDGGTLSDCAARTAERYGDLTVAVGGAETPASVALTRLLVVAECGRPD